MMRRIIIITLLYSCHSFLLGSAPSRQLQRQRTAFLKPLLSSPGNEEWSEFNIQPGETVDVNRMEVVGSDYSNDVQIDSVLRCVAAGVNFAGTLTQKAQVICSLGPGEGASSSPVVTGDSDDLDENEYTVNRGTAIDKTRMYVLNFEASPDVEPGTILRTLKPGVMGEDGNCMHLAEVVASSGPDGSWKPSHDRPVEVSDGMASVDIGSADRSPGMVGFSSGTLGPPGGLGRQSGYTYGKAKRSSSSTPPSSLTSEDFRYYTPPSMEDTSQQESSSSYSQPPSWSMEDKSQQESSSHSEPPSWTQDGGGFGSSFSSSTDQQQHDFYGDHDSSSSSPEQGSYSQPPSWTQDADSSTFGSSMEQQQHDVYGDHGSSSSSPEQGSYSQPPSWTQDADSSTFGSSMEQQQHDVYGDHGSSSSSPEQGSYSQPPSWTQDADSGSFGSSTEQQQHDFYGDTNNNNKYKEEPSKSIQYPHEHANGTSSINCNPVGEMWYQKEYAAEPSPQLPNPAESGIESLRKTFQEFEQQVGGMLNEELNGMNDDKNSGQFTTKNENAASNIENNNSTSHDEVERLKKEVERLETVIIQQSGTNATSSDGRALQIQEFLAGREERIAKLQTNLDLIMQDYVTYEDQIRTLFVAPQDTTTPATKKKDYTFPSTLSP